MSSNERELLGCPTPVLCIVALRGDRTYHAQLVINGIVIATRQVHPLLGAALVAAGDHLAFRARVFAMQGERDGQRGVN